MSFIEGDGWEGANFLARVVREGLFEELMVQWRTEWWKESSQGSTWAKSVQAEGTIVVKVLRWEQPWCVHGLPGKEARTPGTVWLRVRMLRDVSKGRPTGAKAGKVFEATAKVLDFILSDGKPLEGLKQGSDWSCLCFNKITGCWVKNGLQKAREEAGDALRDCWKSPGTRQCSSDREQPGSGGITVNRGLDWLRNRDKFSVRTRWIINPTIFKQNELEFSVFMPANVLPTSVNLSLSTFFAELCLQCLGKVVASYLGGRLTKHHSEHLHEGSV